MPEQGTGTGLWNIFNYQRKLDKKLKPTVNSALASIYSHPLTQSYVLREHENVTSTKDPK